MEENNFAHKIKIKKICLRHLFNEWKTCLNVFNEWEQVCEEIKKKKWIIVWSPTNENTFIDSLNVFCFNVFLSHCFSLLSPFGLPTHFEIITCIVKSSIATSTYFLLKYNWLQGMGTQAGILVSQAAWIHHWY